MSSPVDRDALSRGYARNGASPAMRKGLLTQSRLPSGSKIRGRRLRFCATSSETFRLGFKGEDKWGNPNRSPGCGGRQAVDRLRVLAAAHRKCLWQLIARLLLEGPFSLGANRPVRERSGLPSEYPTGRQRGLERLRFFREGPVVRIRLPPAVSLRTIGS